MIAILTIDEIPKNCNDNCICNHDGWCYAIHTGDGTSFDYQEAQNVRPLNCPLVELSKIPKNLTTMDYSQLRGGHNESICY